MGMTVDFKQFRSIAPHIVVSNKGTNKAPYPVMLRGRHGVGKSCVVYQTANSLCWDAEAGEVVVKPRKNSKLPSLRVIERRASQMTEGDLIGLPSIDGNVTRFNPPDWLQIACEEPVVLFFDELDRAVTEVRQGFFELTDSRKCHGHHLHEGTVIFAAINGGDSSSQYQVADLDPAELDRWTVFDVEPTVEDWLDWAKSETEDGCRAISKFVWDFINNNHQHLEHKGDFEPNKVYPSRRSWERFDKTVKAADLVEDPKKNMDLMFELANAFVGFEAAVAIKGFCKTYEAQVKPSDILVKGQIERTKDWGINEHSALVEKMEAEKSFAKKLPKKQIQNLARYLISLPSEVAFKLFLLVSSTEEDARNSNTIALHQAEVDGKAVSTFLSEILASGVAEKKEEDS